jgi:hypothetical protein
MTEVDGEAVKILDDARNQALQIIYASAQRV